MIKLSQDRSKTLLAIHGWSGALLGMLLYAVILTGVVAVFAEEMADWASPLDQAPATPIPRGIGAKMQALSTQVDPAFLEELFFLPDAGGRIRTFFHHDITPPGKKQPEGFGTEFDLHPVTLEVLEQRDGFEDDIDARNRSSALSAFLVKLHVSLHLPDPWGLLLTGALGLAMMVAAVTGLVVHRHLIKELFTIRRHGGPLLARRDAHVIAGTWNLPFAFVLAFTGSYFSFAGSIGIPAMSMVAFGGDQQALFDAIVGHPPPENRAAAPMGDLDAMLDDARVRAHAEPSFVSIDHYGRADATVHVFSRPAEGRLFSTNLVYDGPSGAFLRQKPGLGLVPSAGGALADLMGPLHFGNFAGLLSKCAWFALGFASLYVSLTGMVLWTTRRAEEPAWRRLARAVLWMGYGLPLALVLTPWGYLLGRAAGRVELEMPMAVAFVGAAVAAALLAWRAADPDAIRRRLLLVTGIGLLGLPVLRLLTGGPGWLTAWSNGLAVVPSLDVALAVGGAACVWFQRRKVSA